MDVNEELKFLRKLKIKKIFTFFFGGGGGGSGQWGVGLGGQGRCEQRSEVFVKNKKKCGGVQVGGFGRGGGGGVGGVDGGVRVDVNEELKFFVFFWGGGRVGVGLGGVGGGGGLGSGWWGGSGWM